MLEGCRLCGKGSSSPDPESGKQWTPFALGTRGRTRGRQDSGDPELPSSTVQALPVRVGPANPDGKRTYQYWPFSTSDLYNWKTQNPPFSEKPQGLIDLLDSILFTHNPTWDDCQQLLQVLFTTEEQERILAEAQKRVPGVDGRPTTQPHLVDEGFPLLRPNWDFEQTEGQRDWTLGSLQSRAASHSRRTGKSAGRTEGESSPIKSFETETCSTGGLLILLLMAALIDPGATSHNPHHPVNMTWVVYNPETGGLLNSSSNVAPKGT
ncbi:uncharacterized protein [Odocoileus virginianus]|uniref:Core shell protein Gag P30 domain-containing protein n=1 Tax=Odocoileus virginianus TaxID=9874 RepID=A0ABM4HDB9_ODOVR